MTSRQTLCIVIASSLLTACATSTTPFGTSSLQPSPLVVSNCPDLTPLDDDSFGATKIKLVEVAGIYYKCRAAALGSTQ